MSSDSKNVCLIWLKRITVEPVVGIFFFGYTFTQVVEQSFFIYKACRVDHGLPEELCRNLTANKTIEAEVQITVSEFLQYNSIVRYLIPMFVALFLGNWSDRWGRKIPILVGTTSMLIYAIMMILNTLIFSWNLSMVIYSVSLPVAALGGDIAIMGSSIAYISDVTTPEERSIRFAIFDVVAFVALVVGAVLGGQIFANVVNSSYTMMFIILAVMTVIAIIYAMLRLNWQTVVHKEPLSRSRGILRDLFNLGNLSASFKTLKKRRPENGRIVLQLLLLITMLGTFPRDEKITAYLYTKLVFQWTVTTYSNMLTYYYILGTATLTIGIPILSRVLGCRDTVIIMVGIISCATGKAITALFQTPLAFYGGMALCSVAALLYTTVKTMISKITPMEERGKIFFLMFIFDKATSFLANFLYSTLYKATLQFSPGSMFWLTFGAQSSVFVITTIIHIIQSPRNEAAEPEEVEKLRNTPYSSKLIIKRQDSFEPSDIGLK